MKIGLREDEAIQEAREESNLLIGFTVTPDHSLVLCERGYTDYYRKHKEERDWRRSDENKNMSTMR